MNTFQLILFDLDDTLLYFEDYWETSARETFQSFALTRNIDSDRLFETYRKHDSHFESLYLGREITIGQYREYRIIHTLRDHGIEADETVARAFENDYARISRKHMKPREHVTNTLQQLHNEFYLGIVTNGTARRQYEKIVASGLHQFFLKGSVFISEEVGAEKPDPYLFLTAVEHFAVFPDDTLFVGDNWNNDVAGPARTGIRSVWLNGEDKPVPAKNVAYRVIKELPEIIDIAKKYG